MMHNRGLWMQMVVFALAGMALPAQSTKKPEVRALEVKSAVAIDGRLDEPDWQLAQAAKEFVQFAPARGEAAAFATEVRVLLAKDRIIFGFICRDPEPDRITAQLTGRDSDLTSDDSVGIGLDTFLDRRTAYYFFTNPLGTQMDGRISDNGRTTDNTWDGEWRAAALRGPEGWTAEVEIPLSTLKYRPGKGQRWGFGVVRTISRRLETDTWPVPPEMIGQASTFGDLTGLDLESAKKRLEVVPHLVGKLQLAESTGISAGADVRWAVTQDISTNLTINPDFATIEADQEQVNLTRFELSLPEKRQFFLEGNEIYSQRIQLFYSRRIADIWGGVKGYGKKGGTEFAAMAVRTKTDEALSPEQATFGVLRLRQDIFKSSTIGFLAANRNRDGKNLGSVGLDLVHFFSEKVNVTGQLAVSYGDWSRGNMAFYIRPSYDSATSHFHLRYSQLGEHFADDANAVGFIQDDDRRELDSAVEKTWWLKRGFLERIAYESNYNIYWGMSGTLRSWQVDQGLAFDLRNRFSVEVGHEEEFKRYEKDFRNRQSTLELGYNMREWQAARVSYSFGRSFDKSFRLWEAGVNRKLGSKLSLEYDLTRLYLDPDPEKETTWIHVLRLSYFFNPDLFVKLFYQLNSSIEKKNIQLVFVWRFRPPFGLLQLAYQQGSLRFGERGDTRPSLFLKWAFVF